MKFHESLISYKFRRLYFRRGVIKALHFYRINYTQSVFPRLRLEVCNIDTMYDRETTYRDKMITISWSVLLVTPPLILDVRCGMFQIDSNHLLAMNVTMLSFILSYLTKRRQSCALSLPQSIETHQVNSQPPRPPPCFSLYTIYLLTCLLEDPSSFFQHMVQYLNIIAKVNELKKFTEIYSTKLNFFHNKSSLSKIKKASIKILHNLT